VKRANASHTYFVTATKTCTIQWTRIAELEAKSNLNEDEIDELAGLKSKFDLVLSVDYQMSKMLPYWGNIAQSSSTYYPQKVSYDIYGIVDHRDESGHLYLLNKTVGPKTPTTAFLICFII